MRATRRPKLAIPSCLVVTVAGVVAGCSGAPAPAPDAMRADASADGARPDGPCPGGTLFCILDQTLDAGGVEAMCTTTVCNPADCPPGCRAVG